MQQCRTKQCRFADEPRGLEEDDGLSLVPQRNQRLQLRTLVGRRHEDELVCHSTRAERFGVLLVEVDERLRALRDHDHDRGLQGRTAHDSTCRRSMLSNGWASRST